MIFFCFAPAEGARISTWTSTEISSSPVEKKISRNVFEPNKTLQFLLGLGPYSASTGGRGGGGGRGNVHNGRKKIGGGAVVSAAGGRHSADANAALR